MAFDYNRTFKRIIDKATLLEERYSRLAANMEEANSKIELLEAEVRAKDQIIERLESQVEYLRMATTFAPSREQIDKARTMIAGLMRDIDRCITDLSD